MILVWLKTVYVVQSPLLPVNHDPEVCCVDVLARVSM